MEFNLAVEDVHGGETEAIAALGSVVLAKVSREKESRAVCLLVNWGDSARQPHHIQAPYQLVGLGWIGN